MASTSSILLSRSAENPSQSAFFRLKRLLNVVGCATITWFTLTGFTFFHIALLNDFVSFALLLDSAHSSTAYPSLSVEVYPQSVLWQVSACKWREQELFSWWFVHGWLHCNELNIILFTDRNAVNLQTISNKNRASMFLM